MSEMYGFGEQEEPVTEAKEPAWFRSRMDKVSSEIADLKAENDRLKAQAAKQAVKDTLTTQGYAPQVADLYSGQPDGLTDWLGTYGAALAKAGEPAEGQQPVTPQGSPETIVSPESQAALERITIAGQGAAPPLAGDDNQAAQMRQMQTNEELLKFLQDNGNKFV